MKAESRAERRDEFITKVKALADDVTRWAEPKGWVTKSCPKKFRDADHQLYEATALFLQRGATRLLLDPVAYDVPGAEAAVDLALMPTYDDAASLYLENGTWNIHYAFPSDSQAVGKIGETTAFALTGDSLNQILDAIDAHAVQSL
ncbi:MAG TPA: hypothetical protein VMF30_09120 [Pirellulales bacterium]|nr:hypothetical protein [Pirellulales bacterium]